MAYISGTPIDDYFTLVDNSNVAITGKVQGDFATVEAFEIDTPGNTAAVTLIEIGTGRYRVTFTPNTVDQWGARVIYNSGGVYRTYEATYDVLADQVTVVSGTPAGAQVVARYQLRRRISGFLGNMLICTATGNGTTTTFIDTINLKISDNGLVGREAYFYSGANTAISRTISASAYTAASITFPAVTSTLTSDVVEIHNVRASGWRVQEIHDEIDGVLREASASLPNYDRDNIGTAFVATAPTVAIPTTYRGIYQVDWLDADGYYHPIPAAQNMGEQGWWVNRAESELIINGQPRTDADTHTIRIYGAKSYAALTSDASTTNCNEEWLVNQVCANLCVQGRERVSDGSRDRFADWFQKKADARRDLLVQVPPPDFVLV